MVWRGFWDFLKDFQPKKLKISKKLSKIGYFWPKIPIKIHKKPPKQSKNLQKMWLIIKRNFRGKVGRENH